mgnify:CR=1 FL=1
MKKQKPPKELKIRVSPIPDSTPRRFRPGVAFFEEPTSALPLPTHGGLFRTVGALPDLLPQSRFDFGIDPHGEAADAHPEQGEGQADLPPEVQRGVPIVPDRIIPVENKARRQLDHGDDARPDEDFRPGRQAVLGQPPQQQKADSPGQEHGIMAPSPPEKLDGHIQHPAAEEQGQPVKKPFFHKNHLTGKDSQKTCEKFRNSS